MIILSGYIAQHELKPLRRYFLREDIVDGARKVLKHLAVEIAPPQKTEGVRFFKVRIGRHAKGRMIVFVVLKNSNIVPVLIRLKTDKILGVNMAMNNPAVVKQLNHNLDHVFSDIQNKRFEEIAI